MALAGLELLHYFFETTTTSYSREKHRLFLKTISTYMTCKICQIIFLKQDITFLKVLKELYFCFFQTFDNSIK